MLHGILGLALITAMGAGVTTLAMTGSFVLAALSYAGAGMCVLFALLISEMLFGRQEPAPFSDEQALATDQQS